jgi:hypothetical protein
MRTGVDRAGRGAGIAVFLVGALLLLAVFYLAYVDLIATGALATAQAAAPPTANLALLVATKGLFLFIMGFAASAIANKGIGLFQAATRGEPDR